jgi:hypothetical protein
MDSNVGVYDASGGGVSIDAKGKVVLVGAQFHSNFAGGVGQYESSGGFSGQAESNRHLRASHVLCYGELILERCEFVDAPVSSLAPPTGALWWLLGREFGRLRRSNSSFRSSTVGEGMLRLNGGAEAHIRGCEAFNMTVDPDIAEPRLGIVNSTFDPPLARSIRSIRRHHRHRTTQSDHQPGERGPWRPRRGTWT